MADTAISSRVSRYGQIEDILRHYSSGALTAANDKWRWVIPCYGRIVDVICDSATAGSGGTSDIIDVHVNGTTIYTTQDNRPTLLVGNTGLFSEADAGPDGTLTVVPGDVVSCDVDQIATTGSALFTITILIVGR